MEADGGLGAIALLQGGMALDLLIADLDMPELSGEDMVRRIHAVRPNLKVLYVTGNIDRLLNARSLLGRRGLRQTVHREEGLLEAVSQLLTAAFSARHRKARRGAHDEPFVLVVDDEP